MAGRRAPAFVAETLQGHPVSNADYAGRRTAFLFVDPGCGVCRQALPGYAALRPLAARADVELVLVSLADAAETHAFVGDLAAILSVLVAPPGTNPFKEDYQVQGTPTYCLVDAQGKVESAGYPSVQIGPWRALLAAWGAEVPPQSAHHAGKE